MFVLPLPSCRGGPTAGSSGLYMLPDIGPAEGTRRLPHRKAQDKSADKIVSAGIPAASGVSVIIRTMVSIDNIPYLPFNVGSYQQP